MTGQPRRTASRRTSTGEHIAAVDLAEDTRTPPHDANAEQCVLGAMLLSRDAIADIADILDPRDFYKPVNADLYTAICGLFARGEATDPITVAAHLQANGQLAKLPSAAVYLHDCTTAVPTVANARWYARIVAHTATRRRLIEAGTGIAQLGYAANGDNDDITDRAGQLLYEATAAHLTADLVQVGDLITPTLDAIEAAGQQTGLRGISTGLTDLDKYLHGLQPGQLIVLAARPGMGKTILATDIARAVAINARQPVIYFSLEMARGELMNRILAAQTGIRLDRIQRGKLSEDGWGALTQVAGEIADAPLWIDDSAHVSLMEIRSKSRRLAQRGALSLVIVDYLQLMQSAGRRAESREREVAEISRGLKLLAKELGVPVIAVAQLNRAVEARMDKVPQLSDLRESGAVEQDADVVVLIHREDYYARPGKEAKRPGEVDLQVAKNRNGQLGTVVACAQMDRQRFVDMDIYAPLRRVVHE